MACGHPAISDSESLSGVVVGSDLFHFMKSASDLDKRPLGRRRLSLPRPLLASEFSFFFLKDKLLLAET